MIEVQMVEKQFDFLKEKDKLFIIDFTKKLEELGYTYGGEIGSGFCWGRYMLIFRKTNVKSKNVTARIYMKEDGIVLRLFFNKVSKHAAYISGLPSYIKTVFTGDDGNCKHCRGDNCKFRKDYEIDGVGYEKCNRTTFEFRGPKREDILDYKSCFRSFILGKRFFCARYRRRAVEWTPSEE